MRMILTLAVLGGCMMSSPSDGMRDDMREARDEVQQHVTTSRTADDVSSLVYEVDRHSARMTAILGEMREHMSSMRNCGGMGTMMMMRDGMQLEIDEHQTTMRAMHDLATARTEDEHHAVAMSGMFDDMEVQFDNMHCGGM